MTDAVAVAAGAAVSVGTAVLVAVAVGGAAAVSVAAGGAVPVEVLVGTAVVVATGEEMPVGVDVGPTGVPPSSSPQAAAERQISTDATTCRSAARAFIAPACPPVPTHGKYVTVIGRAPH
jgi:hypothetical protein